MNRSTSDDSRSSSSRLDVATVSGPQQYGFLDPSPFAQAAKKIYLKTVVGGSVSLIIIIFTLFAIYWGALWKTTVHFHNIDVWVVNFDNGPVGSAVVSAIQSLEPIPQRLTWVIKDATEFPGGPQDLANKVHDQKTWVAVSVNPGASSALTSAISSPQQNTNYDGSSAITAYAEEARAENAFRGVLRPQVEAVLQPIAAQFAARLAAQNVSALPQQQLSAIMTSAPQIVTRPIYYTISNLAPFDIPVATAVTFVGLIYLLILGFQFTMIGTGARQMTGADSKLKLKDLIILRIVTPFVLYFFLSLFYSLLSLAFQVSFNRHFGKSGFVIYWMLGWWGMLALGMAMESMITILGPKFIATFLVLWVVVNVSVAFFPIELLPGVYRYGYATPFFNLSQGVRTIMFGTKNKLGLNFGVLIAWTVVSWVVMAVFIVIVRRRELAQVNRGPAGDTEKGQD